MVQFNSKIDIRLERRGDFIVEKFEKDFRCSINSVFPEWNESKATYRYLENEKIDEKFLNSRLESKCQNLVAGKRVIVIGDTCEFNIDNHKKRLKDTKGLGMVGRNNKVGFFLQGLLVLERSSKFRLGWGGCQLFNRPMDNKAHTRDNSSLPIEEKESYKWVGPSIKCRDEVTNLSKHMLFIADREADLYETLDRIPNENTDVLIRVWHRNRWVSTADNQQHKVKHVLNRAKVKCSVTVKINGECKKRKKREAKCKIKYTEVELPLPRKKKVKKNHTSKIKMTLIQIKEVNQSVPKGEKAIEWNLWTSEKIENNDQAIELIECYKSRWHIEEAYRLLKKKGFNFEGTELETGKGIRKLLFLAMEASVKVMQLKAARDGKSEIEITKVFTEPEINVLHSLNEEYQGNTEKQSNPHPKESLAWASWIIARIGGWKGFASQRPPGTITYKRGFDKFENMMLGIRIMNKSRDVYKQ